MNETNNMMSAAGMPKEVQSRMEEIIRKHAEGYCRDLPMLVDKLRAHVDDLAVDRNAGAAFAGLEREAHDMKGQAATFGLPEIAALAGSLCHLVDKDPVLSPALLTVIDAHVSGLRRLLGESNPELVQNVLDQAKALGGR